MYLGGIGASSPTTYPNLSGGTSNGGASSTETQDADAAPADETPEQPDEIDGQDGTYSPEAAASGSAQSESTIADEDNGSSGAATTQQSDDVAQDAGDEAMTDQHQASDVSGDLAAEDQQDVAHTEASDGPDGSVSSSDETEHANDAESTTEDVPTAHDTSAGEPTLGADEEPEASGADTAEPENPHSEGVDEPTAEAGSGSGTAVPAQTAHPSRRHTDTPASTERLSGANTVDGPATSGGASVGRDELIRQLTAFTSAPTLSEATMRDHALAAQQREAIARLISSVSDTAPAASRADRAAGEIDVSDATRFVRLAYAAA